MHDESWKTIFDSYKIHNHDFSKNPVSISAEQIKKATHHFSKVGEKEVKTIFFEKHVDEYSIWQFAFVDLNNYHSIKLVKCGKYKII